MCEPEESGTSQNINLSSNWISQGDKDLTNTISVCSAEQNLETDSDSIASLERCICLMPNNDSDVAPYLEIKTDKLITNINIVCEAQVIEVFGALEEYLLTIHTEFVDDWNGMAVYEGKIQMSRISKCLLKFKRLKDPQRLWIYGIRLTVTEPSEPSEPTKSAIFNFENVNKLIEKSSNQISEKADKFKHFLQMYSANSGKNAVVPPHLLLGMLETQYGSQLQDYRKNFTQRLSQISNFGQFDTSKTNKETGLHQNESLKAYILQLVKETEKNILEEIDRKLNQFRNEQNKKLDRIFALLQVQEKRKLVRFHSLTDLS